MASSGGTDNFLVEAFTYLGLSFAIVALRTFTRVSQLGFSGLSWDDFFIILAMVPYTVEVVLAHLVGTYYHGLTNSGLTDAAREALSLSHNSEEYGLRVAGSKIQVAGWPMYASVLWAIKVSLCAFYSRLTDGVDGYRVRILFGYGLIGGTYVALILCYLASCYPINKFWQIYPDPGNLCQPALSKLYILATVIFNIVTDAYLVIIPIGMLCGIQMPMVKKLSLMVMFSGAIFVMAAALLRGVLIFMNPIDGPRQSSAWAVRESFVAVLTSSLPMIWCWVKIKLKPFLGSLLSSYSKKNGPEPGSIMLGDTNEGSAWRSTNLGTAGCTVGTRGLHEGTDERSCSDISLNGIIGTGLGPSENKHGITRQFAISTKSEDDFEVQGYRGIQTHNADFA